MREDLADRVALVTGAGRGIGRDTALLLAERGASVVISDIDLDVADEAAELVISRGGRAAVCAGDVTSGEFPDRIVDTALGRFGSIDIVVNNAGYVWDHVIQKTHDEQWHAMLDVHLGAPFRLLRRVQPVIREQVRHDRAHGRRIVRKVVNVSSIAGTSGNPGQVGYSSAKAGVIGLTKTLAREWGRLDVTVNCVAFGIVDTRLAVPRRNDTTVTIGDREISVGIGEHVAEGLLERIPMGRTGTPREAAGAISLFCSPDSDYVSGQTIVCGGGFEG